MINPDKVNKGNGEFIVNRIRHNKTCGFKIIEVMHVETGQLIDGYFNNNRHRHLKVDDKVKITAKFSIMADAYKLESIRRILK